MTTCFRKLAVRFVTAITVNLISRKLWLVILALWWSWADLWAMVACLPTLTTPEQVTGFVELAKQHAILTGTIVIGYLTTNAVIRKIDATNQQP
jgi:hypothetical protein